MTERSPFQRHLIRVINDIAPISPLVHHSPYKFDSITRTICIPPLLNSTYMYACVKEREENDIWEHKEMYSLDRAITIKTGQTKREREREEMLIWALPVYAKLALTFLLLLIGYRFLRRGFDFSPFRDKSAAIISSILSVSVSPLSEIKASSVNEWRVSANGHARVSIPWRYEITLKWKWPLLAKGEILRVYPLTKGHQRTLKSHRGKKSEYE